VRLRRNGLDGRVPDVPRNGVPSDRLCHPSAFDPRHGAPNFPLYKMLSSVLAIPLASSLCFGREQQELVTFQTPSSDRRARAVATPKMRIKSACCIAKASTEA
jgi:hypothetical protein